MDKNRFLIDLSASDRTETGRVDFAAQRPEQRVFSAVWALESQVNNGGFAQYFASHDGETATSVPVALREIGAHQCAAIVAKALEAVTVAGSLPPAQADREALIESLPPDSLRQLEGADREFFSYPDDLTDLLFRYVAKHPLVFGKV